MYSFLWILPQFNVVMPWGICVTAISPVKVICSKLDSYRVCPGDSFKNRIKSPVKSSSPVATAALVSPDSATKEATEPAATTSAQNEETQPESNGLKGVPIEADMVEGGVAQDDAEGDGDLAIDSGEDDSADESDSEGLFIRPLPLTRDTCYFSVRTTRLRNIYVISHSYLKHSIACDSQNTNV
jgi:hypothetical protein